ncbi:serine/threonine-protein kinase [Nocardia lasii]|uniref:non-specific serine/threonine protein kinase n=1 Tax=Nocardia lasii TaxID=1616107 RepID=A0ABW1JPU7_9NOCA
MSARRTVRPSERSGSPGGRAGSVHVVLETGARFAGYRVERVLGRGGMGTVYLAEHPRLPRSVALKLLGREFSGDPELQRRFEREADVVAQLDHPGIVGVFDRGSDDGYLWIAMQYIRGSDAADWDARAHEPGVTARLIGETAAALDYANRHGVLHRDVKPGNILIADADRGLEQRSVLTDFGIARVTTAATQLTATGTFTATLAYASPEQLSGEVVDHRSDQYSLACTLFAMYAGHPPFTATNPGQVVAAHLSQPVPRLSAIRSDLPPAIDSVIARAMAKRRDERFSSATEFTEAVREVLAGRHLATPTVWQPWADPQRPPVGSGEHARVHPARPRFESGGQFPHPNAVHRPESAYAAARPGFGVAVADPRFAPAPFAGYQPGRPPSRVTATIAGIGALLIGGLALAMTVFAIYLTDQASAAGQNTDGNAIGIAILGCGGLLALAAGTLMLRGRTSGRVMTVIVAVPVVLYAIGATVAALAEKVYVAAALVPIGAALTIAVIVCACTASTGRWVRYRKALRANRR